MGDIPQPWPDDPVPKDPSFAPPVPHDPPRLPGQDAVEAPDIRPAARPSPGARSVPDEDVVGARQSSDGVPSEPPD